MGISKRKLLMNAFFEAQFSYCPLVWMCNSRSMNNKINRPHERYLWVIYNDKTSSFADFLAKDRSVTMHTRNVQILATEMFKANKNMPTELMQVLFCVRRTYHDLRNPRHFAIPSINSVYHGSESIQISDLEYGN